MYIREREREREREMLTGANTLSTLLAIYSRESSKTKTLKKKKKCKQTNTLFRLLQDYYCKSKLAKIIKNL